MDKYEFKNIFRTLKTIRETFWENVYSKFSKIS